MACLLVWGFLLIESDLLEKYSDAIVIVWIKAKDSVTFQGYVSTKNHSSLSLKV